MAFSRTDVRSIATLVLRIGMAAVFLVAAWSKLSQPWAMFAIAIDAYGILPESAVVFVARTLPWAELALGLALLAGLLPRISSVLASAILAGFFTILIRSYVKGLDIDCGCFGFGEKLTVLTLVRDGVLLAASLALAALCWVRRP
jgi:uncharacterized membrane protein YphA (DoxX/SURF4 family)